MLQVRDFKVINSEAIESDLSYSDDKLDSLYQGIIGVLDDSGKQKAMLLYTNSRKITEDPSWCSGDDDPYVHNPDEPICNTGTFFGVDNVDVLDVMFVLTIKDLYSDSAEENVKIKFPVEFEVSTRPSITSEQIADSLIVGYDFHDNPILARLDFERMDTERSTFFGLRTDNEISYSYNLYFYTHTGVKIAGINDFLTFDCPYGHDVHCEGGKLVEFASGQNSVKLGEIVRDDLTINRDGSVNVSSLIPIEKTINIDYTCLPPPIAISKPHLPIIAFRLPFVTDSGALARDDGTTFGLELQYFTDYGQIFNKIDAAKFIHSNLDLVITDDGNVKNARGQLSDSVGLSEDDLRCMLKREESRIDNIDGLGHEVYVAIDDEDYLNFYTKKGVKFASFDIDEEDAILNNISNIRYDSEKNLLSRVVEERRFFPDFTIDDEHQVKYNLDDDTTVLTLVDKYDNNIYCAIDYGRVNFFTHAGVFIDKLDINIPKLSENITGRILESGVFLVSADDKEVSFIDGEYVSVMPTRPATNDDKKESSTDKTTSSTGKTTDYNFPDCNSDEDSSRISICDFNNINVVNNNCKAVSYDQVNSWWKSGNGGAQINKIVEGEYEYFVLKVNVDREDEILPYKEYYKHHNGDENIFWIGIASEAQSATLLDRHHIDAFFDGATCLMYFDADGNYVGL